MAETLFMERPSAQARELSAPVGTILAGVALIAWTGLRCVGALSALTVTGSVLAAGIARRERWGWVLGLAIAAANAVGYVLSRSVGIPHMRENSWDESLEPIGIASLVVKLLFVVMAAWILTRHRRTE
jgi:hypothetical protein